MIFSNNPYHPNTDLRSDVAEVLKVVELDNPVCFERVKFQRSRLLLKDGSKVTRYESIDTLNNDLVVAYGETKSEGVSFLYDVCSHIENKSFYSELSSIWGKYPELNIYKA